MAILNKAKAAKAETASKKTETAPKAEAAKTEAPKAEAPKAAAPKAEKAPAKKSVIRKASAAKKAADPVVTLTVQYMGKEMTQQAMVEAVKAQVQGEIKTLDLYAKPEEAAVYYVVNGDVTGKVEF